jgi:hypothetical protein
MHRSIIEDCVRNVGFWWLAVATVGALVKTASKSGSKRGKLHV